MPDVFVSSKKKGLPKAGILADQQAEKKLSKRERREIVRKLGKSDKHGMGPRYKTVVQRLNKQRQLGRFKSFNILPGKVRFETQEMREKVVLVLRQHWITQIKWLFGAILMIFTPVVLLWIPLINFLPDKYQFMSILIWYLLIIAFIYEKFISWFFHIFIVTDERVIDIDFYNLLYKEVSEAKIDNIEDVTYTQSGVSSTMFNLGDISLQTAGEKQEFKIERVPQPDRIVKILNELKLEEEHEKIMGKVR